MVSEFADRKRVDTMHGIFLIQGSFNYVNPILIIMTIQYVLPAVFLPLNIEILRTIPFPFFRVSQRLLEVESTRDEIETFHKKSEGRSPIEVQKFDFV